MNWAFYSKLKAGDVLVYIVLPHEDTNGTVTHIEDGEVSVRWNLSKREYNYTREIWDYSYAHQYVVK